MQLWQVWPTGAVNMAHDDQTGTAPTIGFWVCDVDLEPECTACQRGICRQLVRSDIGGTVVIHGTWQA